MSKQLRYLNLESNA